MCYIYFSNLISYCNRKKGEMIELIKTNELKGLIAKNGLSQSDMATKIGITPKTFYEKMKNGVFGSDEMQVMIDVLHIEDPAAIFFAKE